MSPATYSVLCDLGLENFDEPRVGHAAARAAFTELRQMGKLEGAVRSTRFHRPEPLTVQIAITLDATSSWEAFELARAMLRSAVHAVGGSTAGWHALRPIVVSTTPSAGRRRRRHRTGVGESQPAERFPSWEARSAAARARADSQPPLPPMRDAGSALELIDLR